MSTTMMKQTNARVREPDIAAMERPETGVEDKGLSTKTLLIKSANEAQSKKVGYEVYEAEFLLVNGKQIAL
jgi:hypothetical protein